MRCPLILIVLGTMLLPSLGLCDGKFYWREKVPPGIPYQRAVIMFDNDIEVLVLQSKYDLSMQIEVKMAILELRRRVTAGGNSLKALHGIVSSLGKWHNKHGFSDRYYGPFRNLLHPVLKKLSGQIKHCEHLSESLRDFESGPKHGSFVRLFETLINICREE